MTTQGLISAARVAFHAAVLDRVLRVDDHGVPSNADRDNTASVAVAQGILNRIGKATPGKLSGQTTGTRFEEVCASFLEDTFLQLHHLRPGKWHITRLSVKGRRGISRFEQYAHLAELERLVEENPQLAAAIGSDYIIKPDVMIFREPEDDEVINASAVLVDEDSALQSSLRRRYQQDPLLHASVSCKWTIRSDRAQNTRSEALNLIRNRKGRLPHVAAVTAEPLPNRIVSLALGTGDIDCVYHFALPELQETLSDLGKVDAGELLGTMIEGKRLKDISDLPLDLAV